MTFFGLALWATSSLHPDGEPDDFITEFTGIIRCEDDTGRVRRGGKAHAYRIEAALAARPGQPLFDVCDAHSQEMHEVHSLLYESGGYGFKEFFIDRFDAMEWDCLVLDYLVLHPRWRGLRLGLLAARKMVDLLGSGCGLTVAEVLPLDPRAYDLVGVPAPAPTSLSVRARFDAAAGVRVSCTLPGSASARLELYDIAGRRRARERIVTSGEFRIAGTRALESGWFIVRITSGPQSAASRFVVAH